MKCKICDHESAVFDSATVLARHHVQYFRCENCGFIQTEDPYWLPESYTEAINNVDIGLVSRNIRLAKCTEVVIDAFFASGSRFLDYGGGYGMLVRIMRDRGHNFFRLDTHCANLFAKSFDVEDAAPGNWDLVTAFEVFEHLSNPLGEVKDMLSYSRNILFTTTLVPRGVSRLKDWWYFGPEHGQHIAIFTHKALETLARRNNLNLSSDGVSFHLLTEKKIHPRLFWLLSRYRVATLVNSPLRAMRGRDSFAKQDFEKISGIRQ